MLEELEEAARKLGVKVSYESLAATVDGGGLCKVKGEYRVIIDKRGTVGEKVATLAMAVARLDADAVFLSPETRKVITQYRSSSRA